ACLQWRSNGQAASVRRRHRQGAMELQYGLRNARRHRQLLDRWRAVHLGGEWLGLVRGDPAAAVVSATGKGPGGFHADRLQGFEIIQMGGGSNAPPPFQVQTMWNIATLACAVLVLGSTVERLRADEIPNLEDPKMISAGHDLFLEKQCAHCHGEDGK